MCTTRTTPTLANNASPRFETPSAVFASSDFSAVNLYNLPGATTWPITMISYFYIEKDLSGMDPETAALLMAFVKMVLSEEGQSLAEDNMFVKLPAGVLAYNEATLASITLPSGYAALSTRRIASAVGCTATSIYLHFKSKDSLIYALLDEGFQALHRRELAR